MDGGGMLETQAQAAVGARVDVDLDAEVLVAHHAWQRPMGGKGDGGMGGPTDEAMGQPLSVK